MTTNDPYHGPDPEPQYPHQPQEPAFAQAPYEQPGPFAPHAQYPHYAAYGYYAPPPVQLPRKRHWRLRAGIAAMIAAALVGGIAIGNATSGSTSGSGSSAIQQSPGNPDGGIGGILPGGGSGGGSNGGGTSTGASLANEKQKTGVVTIVSTLRYQNSQSAGTGMILTSDGAVLTNNHVIEGATSIVVTVASTGKSYTADVVGTAPTEDIAVLKLRNASGLKTANFAGTSGATVGEKIVGVGNAGGTGTLQASSGKVTAVEQTITASDDGSGTNAEKLEGLIEVNAQIISGDSGGPLYDSSGKVIGMDTAAAANSAVSRAYAIPIEDAMKVVAQIEKGVETPTIHIGYPAFLGVGVDDSTNGALVTSLLDGGPAAGAGITRGSVITKVGDTAVTSAGSLKTALQKYRPGDHAKVTWTDSAGAAHTATVTLATGPAD